MKALSLCVFVAFAGVASAAFPATLYTNRCLGSGCGLPDTNVQQGALLSRHSFNNSLVSSIGPGDTMDGSFTVAMNDVFLVANGNEEAIGGELMQISGAIAIPGPGTWVIVATAILFVIVSRLARL
jgi:hypothetical protein